MLEELMLIGTILFWGLLFLFVICACILGKRSDGDDK